MKSYVDASKIPTVKIGEVIIPRLILGHLPFIGESYQGIEKNRMLQARFSNVENTIRILSKASAKYGITVLSAEPGETKFSSLFLRAIEETIRRVDIELALIPCIRVPLIIEGKPVDEYRRWITYYAFERKSGENVLERYLEDPILQCREDWKKRFLYTLEHGKPYGIGEFEKIRIDYKKLSNSVESIIKFKILFFELGSETDFLAIANRLDLLSEAVDWIRANFNRGVFLGVHHAGSTIPILDRSGVRFDAYIAPINKLGIMMLPTEDTAVKSIKHAAKPVIAIKPLAGGRIPPNEAFEYIYSNTNVASCLIGVASEDEMDEDVKTASIYWNSTRV